MHTSTHLNGYKVYPFQNRESFLTHLSSGKFNKILIAINAEKLMKDDGDLKKLVNSNIGYPDGVGAVLALKRKGFKSSKIPGAELWLDIINKFYKEKTFYLVGGETEIIKTTVQKLQQEFSGIQIVNYRNGYMNEGQKEELIRDITEKKPDIVFVAMGSPKQEFLMQQMLTKHEALYMGLGGSFDIYTGIKERAPKFLREVGLEWLSRLLKEPKRIKRQLVYVPFLLKMITNRI